MNILTPDRFRTTLTAGVLLAAAGFAPAPQAEAELLAYEGFDYDRVQWFTTQPEWIMVDGIGGLDGGTGFDAGWDDQSGTQLFDNDGDGQPELYNIRGGIADVNNPGDFTAETAGVRTPLGYTDAAGNSLRTTGNQYRGAFGNRNREFRALSTTLGQTGTSAWFSFLAQSDSVGSTRYSRVGLTNSLNTEDGVFFGKINGDDTWAIQSPTVRSEITVDEQVLFLARIDFNDFLAGESDVVSVWLNPESLEDEPTSDPTLLIDAFTGDLSLDTLQLHGRFSTDYDEFRLGTTFASVTPFVPAPEPGTVALMLAGIAGLVGRGRRSAR